MNIFDPPDAWKQLGITIREKQTISLAEALPIFWVVDLSGDGIVSKPELQTWCKYMTTICPAGKSKGDAALTFPPDPLPFVPLSSGSLLSAGRESTGKHGK